MSSIVIAIWVLIIKSAFVSVLLRSLAESVIRAGDGRWPEDDKFLLRALRDSGSFLYGSLLYVFIVIGDIISNILLVAGLISILIWLFL